VRDASDRQGSRVPASDASRCEETNTGGFGFPPMMCKLVRLLPQQRYMNDGTTMNDDVTIT
jgi:hypothetical protein